jgi:hypothetical protein
LNILASRIYIRDARIFKKLKKKQQIKGGGINNFACDVKLNKNPRPMILNSS